MLYVTNAYTNRQVFITFNVTTSKKQLGVCTLYSLKSRSAIAFVCRDLCAESLNHIEPVNLLIFIRLYIESMRTLNKMVTPSLS